MTPKAPPLPPDLQMTREKAMTKDEDQYQSKDSVDQTTNKGRESRESLSHRSDRSKGSAHSSVHSKGGKSMSASRESLSNKSDASKASSRSKVSQKSKQSAKSKASDGQAIEKQVISISASLV